MIFRYFVFRVENIEQKKYTSFEQKHEDGERGISEPHNLKLVLRLDQGDRYLDISKTETINRFRMTKKK